MRWRLLAPIFIAAALAAGCNSLELRLYPIASSVQNAVALEATRAALEARVHALGHVDVKVDLEPGGSFVVRMSAGKAPPRLLETLAAPGRVTFVAIPAGVEPPLEGSAINPGLPQLLGPEAVLLGSAQLGTDITGHQSVDFHLTPAASEVFRRHTHDHIGEFLAIVLDGRVISTPTIRDEIGGGVVAIEFGAGTPPVDVTSLFAYLASGPLPIAISPPSGN